MAIISLSTIPPRFDKLGPTLESLLKQTADVEAIQLYIPHKYRRFPDYDGTIPKVPAGITVIRAQDDLGPASKVLFCARALRGTNTAILFCDDDHIYPANWAETLLSAAERHPDRAICLWGGRISSLGFAEPERPRKHPAPPSRDGFFGKRGNYRQRRVLQQISNLFRPEKLAKPPHKYIYDTSGELDFFCGFQGVVVRPDWFDDDAFDIPPVLWSVDDMWLSGQIVKKGITIWGLAADYSVSPVLRAEAHSSAPLVTSVNDGNNRFEADRACVRYFQETYGTWR